MLKPRNHPEEAPQGSILIIALWLLFVLAALAVAMGAYIAPQIAIAQRLKNNALLPYIARAAIFQTMNKAARDAAPGDGMRPEAWRRNENEFKESVLGQGVFSIMPSAEDALRFPEAFGLADEERKININKAPREVLSRLFQLAAYLSPKEADRVTGAILDWRDPNKNPRQNGSDNDYYQSLNPPYSCKHSKFEIIDELKLVHWVTGDIFERVRSRLTVYGEGQINVNTADSLVLQSLGCSAMLTDQILRFRAGPDGGEGTADDRVFAAVEAIPEILQKGGGISAKDKEKLKGLILGGWLSTGSSFFSGVARVHQAGSKDFLDVSFIFGRNKKIMAWSEA